MTGVVVPVLAAGIAAVAIGCHGPATAPTGQNPEEAAMSWSPTVAGLKVGVEFPPGPLSIAEPATVTLHFHNDSDHPLRIYLIQSEPFRGFQSYFGLRDAQSGSAYFAPPEMHPHGYVVTERDFHPIEPGAEASFTQALSLRAVSRPGPLAVEYTYENKIESWPGGVQTLDGPTRALFGGGRIPDIWLGKVRATATVEVTR